MSYFIIVYFTCIIKLYIYVRHNLHQVTPKNTKIIYKRDGKCSNNLIKLNYFFSLKDKLHTDYLLLMYITI